MTDRRPSVSKAIKAVQALGLQVTAVEIAPDGAIRVLTSGEHSDGADDEIERSRARRRARKDQRAAHHN